MRFIINITKELIKRYNIHNVGQTSAALTYYLIFTGFPFLLFLSALPSFFGFDKSFILSLSGIIPSDVIDIFSSYLNHVSQVNNKTPLILGLVMSIWFIARAMNCLVSGVKRANDISIKSKSPFHKTLIILLASLSLVIAIPIAIAALSITKSSLVYLSKIFPFLSKITLNYTFIKIIILFFDFGFLILLLYSIVPGGISFKYVLPGTVCTLFAWIIISTGYGFYVEYIANYSVLYGAIGTVIVLMLWLYLCSVVTIMGAELNSILVNTPKVIKIYTKK